VTNDPFTPRALLTRMFLGLLAAANMPDSVAKPGLRPFVAQAPTREAAHSARHARRHGQYVGPVVRTINQGRSRLCPCGSGQKYKRCHLTSDVAAEFQRRHGLSGRAQPLGKTLAKAA